MREERQLAAIMLASVADYARLARQDESATLHALAEQRRFLRDAIGRHRGREIKVMGQRTLVRFSAAGDAVDGALDAQRLLHDRYHGSDPAHRVQLRIGLHVGDIVIRSGDVFGDGVNIASRIEPLAEPGGICVSQSVYDQMPDGYAARFEDLGERALHNVRIPVRVYRVLLPWMAPPIVTAPADPRRIAVLPFAYISASPGDAYLADGMTEELIHTLSRLPNLHVSVSPSVARYRSGGKSVAEIGRELGVGTIIEGSVRASGDRLRITVQLIDVSTQEHLWSQVYDRSAADVLAVQEEIARRVATALRVDLPGDKGAPPR